MNINFLARSNSDDVYVNTISLILKGGEEIVLDRDETTWSVLSSGLVAVDWENTYRWDPDTNEQDYSYQLPEGAVIRDVILNVEDDAPEGYFIEPDIISIGDKHFSRGWEVGL